MNLTNWCSNHLVQPVLFQIAVLPKYDWLCHSSICNKFINGSIFNVKFDGYTIIALGFLLSPSCSCFLQFLATYQKQVNHHNVIGLLFCDHFSLHELNNFFVLLLLQHLWNYVNPRSWSTWCRFRISYNFFNYVISTFPVLNDIVIYLCEIIRTQTNCSLSKFALRAISCALMRFPTHISHIFKIRPARCACLLCRLLNLYE